MKKLSNGSGSRHDIPAVIAFFGGRAELVRALKRHNIIEISPAAIDKWRERGAIPEARLRDLRTLARKHRDDSRRFAKQFQNLLRKGGAA